MTRCAAAIGRTTTRIFGILPARQIGMVPVLGWGRMLSNGIYDSLPVFPKYRPGKGSVVNGRHDSLAGPPLMYMRSLLKRHL